MLLSGIEEFTNEPKCAKEDQDLGWLEKYKITWSNLVDTLNYGFGKV
jgi:hypothetical protein